MIDDEDYNDDVEVGWFHLAAAVLYVLVIFAVIKKCLRHSLGITLSESLLHFVKLYDILCHLMTHCII